MASIRIKTGSEGPSHDPYSYTECIFTRTDGVKVVMHAGLACWCKVYEPGEVRPRLTAGFDEMHKLFHQVTGIWPSQAERIWVNREYPTRCKKCHSKRLGEVEGFPGEVLIQCQKCDAIVGSHFDESAIM